MIFIYCSLVSTWWQWLVNLYKNRKEKLYRKGETIHKTIQKQTIHKTENIQTIKQTYKEY